MKHTHPHHLLTKTVVNYEQSRNKIKTPGYHSFKLVGQSKNNDIGTTTEKTSGRGERITSIFLRQTVLKSSIALS